MGIVNRLVSLVVVRFGLRIRPFEREILSYA